MKQMINLNQLVVVADNGYEMKKFQLTIQLFDRLTGGQFHIWKKFFETKNTIVHQIF